ncbi:MAG TPA: RHS repeat-associated core domain-containing protein [Thermoanaerobaculia bacterium]
MTGPLLFLILLFWIGAARPAAAQVCANASGWDSISYSNFAGTSTSTATCSDTFKCEKAKSTGPVIELVNPSCDPKVSACTIRLRVPLEFPGNKQNIAIAGGSFGAPTPKVYWFQGGTPPASCAPRFDVNCGQISICGIIGAQYTGDFGDTSMTVGGVSCSNLTDPKLTTFSISVFSCESRFSCPKRLDLSGIDLTPGTVAQALGCPVPRKTDCDCTSCKTAGHGSGSGAGDGGSAAPGDSGPGAMLRYAAGGVGGQGFAGSAAWNTALGRYWSHDYAQRIVLDPGVNNDSRVWLLTATATFREFSNLSGGIYQTVSPSDEYRELHRTGSGWELHELDGRVHSFNSSGLWTQTVDSNGNAKVATYSGSQLTAVTFPDGRSETFTYHPSGKLATITEVGVGAAASRVWSYTWTGNDLVRIDRPDGTKWEFFYGDAANPGWMTRMDLVGTDGSRRVDAAWEYDSKGNTTRLWRGDTSFGGANAVEKWSFSYDNPSQPGVTTITDPLGKVATYTIGRDTVSDKPRVTEISGDCPSCGLGPNSRLFYDDPANPLRPTRMIDGRGTTTAFTYNADGLITSKTEAVGTPLERTTTWEYNGPFPGLATRMEVPSTSGSGVRATVSVYDAEGNLTDQTISGVEAGSAFSYTTTTAFNAAGRPLSVDPPGYGVQDVTSNTYDAARGDLFPLTRTEPLVGTTTFAYDGFNRRTSVTDPNGVVTEMAYDALNRVTSTTRRGTVPAEDLVTTNVYNAFGDLLRTILPRGNVIEYGYDAAGRQVTIERKPDTANPGERRLSILDNFGNRTREELQRWNGSAWITDAFTDYVYSTRCHLDKVIHADGTATEYAYDCEGKPERVWDANHPSGNQTNPASQIFTYDVLNRVTAITQPWGGSGGGTTVTQYAYDVQSHLAQVTDPNGTVTSYVYSDRDLLTKETSEVSGITSYSYNEHGARVSWTDARNVTVTHTVDPLDRVTFVDYPDNSLDTTYTYDDIAVPLSKGRLTAIARNGQTVSHAYDRFGRVLLDGSLAYTYDKNGNLLTVAYPGNVTASYTYDFADRQASLSLQDGGNPAQALVTAASYRALGPLTSFTSGNGLMESRSFTNRYFPAGIALAGRLDWTYTTDAIGNVVAVTDNLNAQGSRSFAYQNFQYFLTQGNGPWGTQSWTYDKIGNRLSETRDGVTDTYSYAPNASGANSPQLAQISQGGGGVSQLFYDSAGDLTFHSAGENKLRLGYGADQRLSQLRNDSETAGQGLSQLTYDGRSFLSRASFFSQPGSSSPEIETTATYNSRGVLFHRMQMRRRGPSSPRNEPEIRSDSYILYFASRPAALFEKRVATPPAGSPTLTTKLTYVTTDAVGAPLLATDANAATVWQGGFDPFGKDWNAAQEAGIFLRFPGQWEDATWNDLDLNGGLYQNVYRWYQSSLGQYSQADPIGLRGGPHLYQYAMGRPTVLTDRLGLRVQVCCRPLISPFDGFRHCFVRIVNDRTGEVRTEGLHTEQTVGNFARALTPFGTTGRTETNNDFDRAPLTPEDDCGAWIQDGCGAVDACAITAAASYPPETYYHVFGPNSNTFASYVATVCNLAIPVTANGLNSPGWWSRDDWGLD